MTTAEKLKRLGLSVEAVQRHVVSVAPGNGLVELRREYQRDHTQRLNARGLTAQGKPLKRKPRPEAA